VPDVTGLRLTDAQVRLAVQGYPTMESIHAAPGSARGVVPDIVCRDLQDAQDALQAAGFVNLASRDATGRDRAQVVDRNWVVVAQSVAAGGTPDATTPVLLSAVTFGEPTGASGCPT
jgi:beta-lactam-binding protein with PASTA domain